MTAVWDPDQVLNIRGRGAYSNGIQCNGANGGYGPRCGWTKGRRNDEAPDVQRAEALLRVMAARSPSSITVATLEDLALLCLCRDHHQDQMRRIAQKWAGLVRTAAARYTPPAPAPAPVPAPVSVPVSPLPPIRNPVVTPSLPARTLFTPIPSLPPLTPVSVTPPAPAPTPASSLPPIRNPAVTPSPPAPAPVSAPVPAWPPLVPASTTPPATAAAPAAKFDALQWKSADWQSVLVPLSNPPAFARTSSPSPPPTQSQSVVVETAEKPQPQQQQHADAPTTHSVRAQSPSREHTNSELQAALVKLSALQIQNTELRDQEQRLKALEKEYADFKQSTTSELAGAQVKIVTLEKENKTFRDEADRLQALEAEYSQSSQESNDALIWSQDQLSTLQTQHTDLSEEHDALEVEYAALKDKAAAREEELEQALRSQAETMEIMDMERAEAVAKAENVAAEKAQALADLQSEHEALQDRAELTNVSLKQQTAAIFKLQAAYDTLQSEHTGLKDDYAALSSQYLALTAEHMALQSAHSTVVAESHTQAANLVALQNQIAALYYTETQLRADVEQREAMLQDTREKLGYALRLADEVVSVSFAAAGRANTKPRGQVGRLVKKAGARTVGKVKGLRRSKGREHAKTRGLVAVNEKGGEGSNTGSNPDLNGRQTTPGQVNPGRTSANLGVLPGRSKKSALRGVQGWLKRLGPRS